MFRVRDLIQTDTLDIFLSHVHLDHSVGLTFLYDVLYEKNVSRVTVHLDEPKIETIKEHLFNASLFPVKPNFEFKAICDDAVELSDGSKVTCFPLEHPGGSHGFRLDWPDRSLAYVMIRPRASMPIMSKPSRVLIRLYTNVISPTAGKSVPR